MFGNQITLGAFIEALKKVIDTDDYNKGVLFDFVNLPPVGIHSYRGFYDHLALGHGTEQAYPGPRIVDLIAELEGCVGKIFGGWKGGSYQMTLETPMWVANRGETGDTAIVGVKDKGHYAVILTEDVDC